MKVVKSVTLNLLEPTGVKQEKLQELEHAYMEALVHVVSVANDLFKDAVAILNNGGEVRRVTVPYNIPRSGGFSITEHGNPVVSVATL